MRNSKKIMFISGLIGLGTGLLISGIVLSILLYRVNNKQSPNHINVAQTKKEPIKAKAIQIEPEILNIEIETIVIEIGAVATAREIATILEEQGVVYSSSDFLTYIISQNADRTLYHGTKVFTLNSDNETALKVLTTYE